MRTHVTDLEDLFPNVNFLSSTTMMSARMLPSFKSTRRILSRNVLASLYRRNMSSTSAPYLLTPQELQQKLAGTQGKVAILDATWVMPNSPRSPLEEFRGKRIPNAQFLDLDVVASDHELGLKHMMPSSHLFAKTCGEDEVLGSRSD